MEHLHQREDAYRRKIKVSKCLHMQCSHAFRCTYFDSVSLPHAGAAGGDRGAVQGQEEGPWQAGQGENVPVLPLKFVLLDEVMVSRGLACCHAIGCMQ